MTSPTMERMSELLDGHSGTCISLYLPTVRRFPEHQQNPVKFRNLLREAARTLTSEVGESQADELLAPLYALAENQAFWSHPQDGLAVFSAPGFYRVMKLQRAVPERVVIGESFHTKPLLRIIQSADRFQLLALTREHVRLFQGNRDSIDEVELAEGIPRTLTEAVGEDVTESSKTGTGNLRGDHQAAGAFTRSGIGARKDEVDKDTEKFFRAVDRAICEHYSKPSGLPLLLAALPEHHAPFRQLSHNSYLADEALAINPDSLDLESLRERAWELFEPRYAKRIAQLVDEFNTSNAHGLGSDDPDAIALAVIGGRVKTLLIEADRTIPGHLDVSTGQVRTRDDGASHDDLIDDLAEHAIRNGGEVVIVPPENMPTNAGVAATYRF
jgi:hypothetical protein